MNKFKVKKSDQEADQYLCIRVQLVEVKKGLFGFKDNVYSHRTYLPNMRKEAYDIYEEIDKLAKNMIPKHKEFHTKGDKVQ